MLTSLIGFVLALGVLVTVHEWGHYRVAVACGIRVLRFSIGFGQPLVRWVRAQKGLGTEIEFVICAIPLGGYVKLLDTREGAVAPEDTHLAFDHQSLRSRAAVVIAGPLANFVLAALLYAFTFAMGSWQVEASLSVPAADSPAHKAGVRGGEVVRAVGDDLQDMQAVASLDELRAWLMLQSADQPLYLRIDDGTGRNAREVRVQVETDQARRDGFLTLNELGLISPQTAPVLRELVTGGAAERAGLKKGDRVLSIDGDPVADAVQLKRTVRHSSAGASNQIWRVQRADSTFEITVTLDVVAEAGQPIGRLGAMLGDAPKRVWVSYDLWSASVKALETTLAMTQLTLRALMQMITGASSWDNLGGPVAIAEMAGQSLHVGWHAFLVYLALLSVSLGVFNLLPIPALDGGHLMYYLYEFLAGKAPAQRWVLIFQQAGFFVLMALMAVALFNDLHRLGS